jgi:uncharacterized membrane protein
MTVPQGAGETTRSRKSPFAAAPVWRVGALASVVAVVLTTVFALAAKALDVSLEVDGEAIPIIAFAYITLLFAAVGTVLAVVLARRAKRPARTFVVTTVALTALSLVPPLATADIDTSTRVTLSLSHLVAAAIVIPVLAARLSSVQRTRG